MLGESGNHSRQLSWITLASPDLNASRDFYIQLFDWHTYTLTIAGQGNYEVCTLGDVHGPEVASMWELADNTQPASWVCQFRTEDATATIDAVKAAGGQELIPSTEIYEFGQSSLCADSQGAEFALWKPGRSEGISAYNEPSALCWVELRCRAPQEARRFYSNVFGWAATGLPNGKSYTLFEAENAPVAGLTSLEEFFSSNHPAHWIPYFQVEDRERVTAKATELGAELLGSASLFGSDRCSLITDPHGASFAIAMPHAGPPTRAGALI